MTSDEVDSGFYPPQMERRDWSESFVYVTMFIIVYVYSYIIYTCIIINMLHTLRAPSMHIKCIIV